jgi:hypothetical protein
MTQVRTFSRFTSITVVFALVAVRAPSFRGMLAGSSACAVGTHAPLGTVAATADSSNGTKTVSALPPGGTAFAVVRRHVDSVDGSAPELPPPSDPLHGRIRV